MGLEKRVEFKQGELVLDDLGTLRFGNRGMFATPGKFLHSITLKDLKKIQEFLFPLKYKKVDDHTEAKRTITGGLKIRILDPYTRNFMCQQYCELGKFTRQEYKIIRQYLNEN